MRVLAIDPGTTQSGWVLFRDGAVEAAGVSPNAEVLAMVEDAASNASIEAMACEHVEGYGMAVGKEVFRTVWWTGRFAQAWEARRGKVPIEIPRKEVKLHLCGCTRAKDANIRQALLDEIGPKGTKANPGPTYGVSSHAWAALAVAVTAIETVINQRT